MLNRKPDAVHLQVCITNILQLELMMLFHGSDSEQQVSKQLFGKKKKLPHEKMDTQEAMLHAFLSKY